MDNFSVTVMGSIKGEQQKWKLTGVYGPSGVDSLEVFLQELQDIKNRKEMPWCVGGDFNEVLYLEERNRATRSTRRMNEFRDFVDWNELMDIPLSGVRVTWSNFQVRSSLSKLDRFLVSTDWDEYFSPLNAIALPCPGSDHSLIFLKGEAEVRKGGPYLFKFQNMWLLHPSFVELIRGWWEEKVVWGPPDQRFWLKLKGVRERLRVWNRDVFGDIEKRKKTC